MVIKMRKKYKNILKLILTFVIIILILLFFKKFFLKETAQPAQVIDSIEKFEYTLDDRDSKLMKDNYNELKDILKSKEVNNEEYAKVIAKLFIIDLFTMDNKINKYDVGGVEYVYPSIRDNYKLNVENTLYKSLMVKNNRTSSLPIVKSIEVTSINEEKYELAKKEYTAYKINLKWDYEKDLGYDESAEVICLLDNNVVYVVEYKALGE